jgi:hypothetical protein
MIANITDENGVVQETSHGIIRTFFNHMRRKYDDVAIDESSLRFMENIQGDKLTKEQQDSLSAPISRVEVRKAVFGGARNKAPAIDGISPEFFCETWDDMEEIWVTLFQRMYDTGKITNQQKHGLIVCAPKSRSPRTPYDHRSLTILKADYKILARMIVNRLKPLLHDILHPNQFCGRRDTSIYTALGTIRDTVAYAGTTRRPICLLSLDFEAAFDKISHKYLKRMLTRYGIGDHLANLIGQLYAGAQSTLQINGFLSRRMAIGRSIRQGCPLTMLLHALCINPLLQHLTSVLPGVKILARGETTSIVAYDDDITILLTNPVYVPLIHHALQQYMRASGAVLNTNKSKALALGTWDTSVNILDIPYVAQMKVLGMHCTDATEHSRTLNWAGLAGRTRAITQMAYSRDLCLTQRIWYIETSVRSLIWYMA